MLVYILYKIGLLVSINPPLKFSYAIASAAAYIKYYLSPRDRNAVISNLKIILNSNDKALLKKTAKAVFVNFGKYLVDFFRSSKMDVSEIKASIKVEGTDFLDQALKKKKGIIIVTAHMGNWEIAGAITSLMGYTVNAIALSHKNKKINDLFVSRRTTWGMRVIPVGKAVRKCFECLARNELIALLGDRDFTSRGIPMDFLGKEVLIPKGPATISLKSGAVIIPAFAIRQPDDTYRYTFEKPIEYEPTGHMENDLRAITKKFVAIIEGYIRRYPDQWFMFREFWLKEANDADII